jgi:hypothetical protein
MRHALIPNLVAPPHCVFAGIPDGTALATGQGLRKIASLSASSVQVEAKQPKRPPSPSFCLDREWVGNGREVMGVSVWPDAPVYEEATIGVDDVALLQRAVIHRHVGGDALGVGGFFLIRSSAKAADAPCEKTINMTSNWPSLPTKVSVVLRPRL